VQPDLAPQLQAGLAQMGVSASPAQMENWVAFLGLLYRWNRVHSLTAVPEHEQAVNRHLLDALRVWPHLLQVIQRHPGPGAAEILDVGSGTGVPAIPLAIALPQTHWTLVERVARKAAFLRQAIGRLGLADRVRVAQSDVRDLTRAVGYEIILSRAFAALPRFVEWTQHLAHEQTQWAYLAGRLERIPGLQAEHRLALSQPIALAGLSTEAGQRLVQAVALGSQSDRHLVWVSNRPVASRPN